MKRRILLIFILLCCFSTTLLFSQTNYKKDLYELFISGNVSKWDTQIAKFERDADKKNDAAKIELLGYYYGYIGHLIDIDNKSRSKEYINKALNIAELLLKKYPNNALIKGYYANIIGFQIANSPLRATTLARGMMKNAKSSIELAPNDPTVNILSANIFFYMPDFIGGDTKRSYTMYKKALNQFENNEELRKDNWMYLQLMVTTAIVAEKLERYGEAKNMYEKILKLYPTYSHIRDNRYPKLLKKMQG